MPTFAQPKIEELELPSSTPDDKAIVKVDTTVYGGMAEDMFDETGSLSGPVSSVLAAAIKEWNFTDIDGTPVPITRENIRRLGPADFNFLSEKVVAKLNVIATAQVGADEKKD